MVESKKPLLVLAIIKERDEEVVNRFVKTVSDKYEPHVIYLFDTIAEFHIKLSPTLSTKEYHTMILNKLKEVDRNMYATIVTTVHHPIERYAAALLPLLGYRYIVIYSTPEGELIESLDVYTATTPA